MTPSAAPADHANAEIGDIVAASGTSFALGLRLLPPDRRAAMHALYAFCRVVDDIVDEPGDEADQRRRLGGWRAEIERLYRGAPTHTITRALEVPVEAFDLPREEFLAIIDGMEMDLGAGVRAPTMDGLALYCRRVAGAVGMISVRVFGVADDIGPALAVAQGEALQLTNILRDLVEDAALGRLYLPAELLRKHGIASDEPETVLADPALDAVCRELGARAREKYAEASSLIARAEHASVRPCRLMLEIYRRILDRLERRGWHDIEREVRLTKLEKLWILLRYGL
ncbi:MAG: presqualene diphosphate synthase HpnD [Alphaproteobacteria bacterium]|nr:presqualene diphosphate synthase HpnD [Alphaproteobacteria bacterium]